MAGPPPISSLKPLESRPGGRWTILKEDEDGIILTYAVNEDDSDAITYTLRQCRTEEEVRQHCGSFVFEYTGDDGLTNQDNGESFVDSGSAHDVPLPFYYRIPPQGATEQYAMNQLQHSNQEQFSFSTEAAVIVQDGTHTRAGLQFEETAPQTQLYYHAQGFSMPSGRPTSQANLVSGTVEWSFGNEFLPAAVGNTAISMPSTMVGVGVGMPQDGGMLPTASWQQDWSLMNPVGGHGTAGDWDALFST